MPPEESNLLLLNMKLAAFSICLPYTAARGSSPIHWVCYHLPVCGRPLTGSAQQICVRISHTAHSPSSRTPLRTKASPHRRPIVPRDCTRNKGALSTSFLRGHMGTSRLPPVHDCTSIAPVHLVLFNPAAPTYAQSLNPGKGSTLIAPSPAAPFLRRSVFARRRSSFAVPSPWRTHARRRLVGQLKSSSFFPSSHLSRTQSRLLSRPATPCRESHPRRIPSSTTSMALAQGGGGRCVQSHHRAPLLGPLLVNAASSFLRPASLGDYSLASTSAYLHPPALNSLRFSSSDSLKPAVLLPGSRSQLSTLVTAVHSDLTIALNL
ncbi:hypothetical protein B0H19DRAFT_1374841 [Mycena capillaripes]|nr:hypothetical protein B0H19DRAFT_1374841 [Mycena capillaripes]